MKEATLAESFGLKSTLSLCLLTRLSLASIWRESGVNFNFSFKESTKGKRGVDLFDELFDLNPKSFNSAVFQELPQVDCGDHTQLREGDEEGPLCQVATQ